MNLGKFQFHLADAAHGVYRGHGQDNGQTIADDLDELAPPAFSPDVLPAASGVPSDAENLVKAPAGALPWRDASNACFAADALARASVERGEKDTSAPAQDSGQSLDYAAAASCLLVALGSYWNPVPEESAESKRRPLQV